MKALFLVNARSGPKRRHGIESLIARTCGAWSHEIVACQRKEDLDDVVARADADGFDAVIAVGGDGTVHETAKRLIGGRLALGIVPTGSGNGFARHLGLPMDLTASIRACQSARVVAIDTARVNGVPFLGNLGVGLDAVVAHAFANAGTRGLRTYVRVGLREFRRFTAESYEIDVDGERLERTAMVVVVANSAQYGNNARIAPAASVRDGLLDLVVVEHASLLAAARMTLALFRGTMHRMRGVTTRQGRTIEIRRRSAGPAHLDGEPVMLDDALRVEVVPQSLNVLVPQHVGKI